MTDAERVFGFRAFCFSRGDESALPSFDQNEYVARGSFDRRRLADLVAGIRQLRETNLTVPRRLDDDAGDGWERRAADPCRCERLPTSWRATSDIILIS